MDDIAIRGGVVIDGSGGPACEADVVVRNGRIAAIEPGSARAARRTIDARGLVVAPGFIDIHTHSDFTLPLNPRAESKIRQGVTTEVLGNCGFSVAPALPGRAETLREYLAASAPWLPFREMTFAEYLETFPPTSVNTIMQVGHNTLRLMTTGMVNRQATTDELAQMQRLLADALEAGALGLSSGLFTAPGGYADTDEIVALARVLHAHRGAYASHIRDEANHVFEAVREAIAVGEATGIHVQIAHLKLSGLDNWGAAQRLLGEIEAARRRGVRVDCDQYPYDTGSNPLRNLLPSWVQEGGLPAMFARLQRPDIRARMRTDIARDGLNNFGAIPSWEMVRIAVSPHRPENAGPTLQRDRASSWASIRSTRSATTFSPTRDTRGSSSPPWPRPDVEEIVRTPWVLVGSDGNSLAPYGVTGQGKPHPRFYGTFARVLGIPARPRPAQPAECDQEDDRRIGGSPRPRGRGLLTRGYCADVSVFDPTTIADRATYDEPRPVRRWRAHRHRQRHARHR